MAVWWGEPLIAPASRAENCSAVTNEEWETQTDVSHGLGECAWKDGSQRLKLKAQVSCLLRAESARMFLPGTGAARNEGCIYIMRKEGHGYKEMRHGATNHGDQNADTHEERSISVAVSKRLLGIGCQTICLLTNATERRTCPMGAPSWT